MFVPIHSKTLFLTIKAGVNIIRRQVVDGSTCYSFL
jgi:hypothetical protein